MSTKVATHLRDQVFQGLISENFFFAKKVKVLGSGFLKVVGNKVDVTVSVKRVIKNHIMLQLAKLNIVDGRVKLKDLLEIFEIDRSEFDEERQ
jgi:hypothetical protein